jgi:hypothetical protein
MPLTTIGPSHCSLSQPSAASRTVRFEDITPTISADGQVHGEHEGAEPCFSCPFDEVERRGAVPPDIELEPEVCTGSCLGNLFGRRRSHGREGIRDPMSPATRATAGSPSWSDHRRRRRFTMVQGCHIAWGNAGWHPELQYP